MIPITSTIGGLPPGGPVTGEEVLEAEQNGVSVKIPASSLKGQKGDAGLTAYAVAVADGFNGTVTQWLASLEGDKGDQGDIGDTGKSAYQVAVDAGFPGSEAAWLLSLKGDKGDQGDEGEVGASAYATAVLLGFEGDEAEWLASLKGDTGTQGIQGIQGIQGVSIVAKGSVATVNLIPAAAPENQGWLYTVADTGHTYLSNGNTWIDQGNLRGETGAQGIPGIQGIQGPAADTVVIEGIAAAAEQSNIEAAQAAVDAESSALAALSAGKVFATANAALVSADPVVAVDSIFWVRPNATDALTRMTAYRRTGAGTTTGDYVALQSFNTGTEFDLLNNRFKGDISMLDPAQYKRSGYPYAVVGNNRRLIEKRSGVYQRELMGPTRMESLNGITFLDAGQWARSGIRSGVIGSDRRKIQVETSTAYSFDKPVSAPNLLEAITSQQWARCGKPKVTIGSDRRILVNPAAPTAAATTAFSTTDLYTVYSDDDGSGKQAVYAEKRRTGQRLLLSSAGSNNTNPRIEGGAVIWSSDRASAAPSGLYWSRPDVANEHPVRPLRALACFGDSLTAQNWMANLATAPTPIAATAHNFGRSGETSLAIASRYGAYDNLYTVAGGSIPASGSVAVTNVGKGNPLSRFANVATTLVVYLNGVFGTLNFDGASTTIFTRMASGSAVPSPGTVRCVWAGSPTGDVNPTTEAGLVPNFADMVLIAFAGRNNTVPVQFVLDDFQAMFDAIPTLTRRFLFMPYLPAAGPSEIIGTGAYKNRQDLVSAMLARWPDNTLDLLPAMQAAYNSGIPQDVTDVANGVTPSSLMKVTDIPADYIHPNAAGRVVIANAVAAFLTSKGFLQ